MARVRPRSPLRGDQGHWWTWTKVVSVMPGMQCQPTGATVDMEQVHPRTNRERLAQLCHATQSPVLSAKRMALFIDANIPDSEFGAARTLILDTRLCCVSAAMMLAILPISRAGVCSSSATASITRGNAGQMFRDTITGRLGVQRSRKFKYRGEENTTCRQLWHTCTSVYHLSIFQG